MIKISRIAYFLGVVAFLSATAEAGQGSSKTKYTLIGEEEEEDVVAEDVEHEIAGDSVIKIIAKINGKLRRVLTQEERLIVGGLLQRGVDIESRDSKWGSTALMFAAQRHDIELLKILLAYGADPLAVNKKSKCTAFTFASGNMEVIQLLATYVIFNPEHAIAAVRAEILQSFRGLS